MPYHYVIAYAVFVSALTCIITAYDKIISSSRGKRRISERTLLYFAVFGGAVVEYLLMLIIRHKTRHKKFMIGLPLIIVLQILLIVFLHLWVFKV